MHAETGQHDKQQTVPSSERAMLDKVYRDLVQIHMAIAQRTNDDKEVIPWTERELMSLVREIGAFRREHQPARTA